MTYQPDLHAHTYSEVLHRRRALAVGWLERSHVYPKAILSEDILDRLWAFSRVTVAATRGMHSCTLCASMPPEKFEHGGEESLLGFAEIRVITGEGLVFAAPNLIFHYVRDHQYAPPQIFVDALMTSSAPPADEYFDRLEALRYGWNWRGSDEIERQPPSLETVAAWERDGATA